MKGHFVHRCLQWVTCRFRPWTIGVGPFRLLPDNIRRAISIFRDQRILTKWRPTPACYGGRLHIVKHSPSHQVDSLPA